MSTAAVTTLPSPPTEVASSGIAALLFERGVRLDCAAGEGARAHADRLDTALMALFRDTGSDEAFEALYTHARGRVSEWIRWLVRQRRAGLDPVDLLQDTFVNVYRYPGSFRDDGRASFRSWVRTIAANALRRALTVAARPGTLDLHAGSDPEDTARGPELVAEETEELGALRESYALFLAHYQRAFAQLSPRDRRALELVEVDGRTYAEAALVLGVGSSNMKMIMLRARRRLQKHMRLAMGLALAA
jgi:RNA polymerase sigma-70 factor (ECF subfamily)